MQQWNCPMKNLACSLRQGKFKQAVLDQRGRRGKASGNSQLSTLYSPRLASLCPCFNAISMCFAEAFWFIPKELLLQCIGIEVAPHKQAEDNRVCRQPNCNRFLLSWEMVFISKISIISLVGKVSGQLQVHADSCSGGLLLKLRGPWCSPITKASPQTGKVITLMCILPSITYWVIQHLALLAMHVLGYNCFSAFPVCALNSRRMTSLHLATLIF